MPAFYKDGGGLITSNPFGQRGRCLPDQMICIYKSLTGTVWPFQCKKLLMQAGSRFLPNHLSKIKVLRGSLLAPIYMSNKGTRIMDTYQSCLSTLIYTRGV
eukprot:TRINITY_DN19039_c0_g1_i2.p1 TRINITY_DN19039_c0_g1~~TRINITY_DN19039_c0_g1_i2.p1  ORF type:complete len:101 (-),score=10.28 TRINITY_DN19039_c0_g1_i2:2866-3168(-)